MQAVQINFDLWAKPLTDSGPRPGGEPLAPHLYQRDSLPPLEAVEDAVAAADPFFVPRYLGFPDVRVHEEAWVVPVTGSGGADIAPQEMMTGKVAYGQNVNNVMPGSQVLLTAKLTFRVAIARPLLRAYRGVIERSSAMPAVIVLLFAAAHAYAGEIEPRSYVNTPVGVNFLLAGYAYTDGGLSTPGASPIKGAQLTMHTEVLVYARSLDVWGKSGKVDVILPYSELSESGWAPRLRCP